MSRIVPDPDLLQDRLDEEAEALAADEAADAAEVEQEEESPAPTRVDLYAQRRGQLVDLIALGDTDPRTALDLIRDLVAVAPAPRALATITRTGPYDYTTGDPASVAAGLRVLADAIEAGVIPHRLGFGAQTAYLHGDDQREQLRTAMRFLGGRWDKHGDDERMTMTGAVGGVPVNLVVSREQVCERVVVGREEVEVPASPGYVVEATPARTEVREVVRWDCGSLLAGD